MCRRNLWHDEQTSLYVSVLDYRRSNIAKKRLDNAIKGYLVLSIVTYGTEIYGRYFKFI